MLLAPIPASVVEVPVVAAVPGVSAAARALAPWFEPIAPTLMLDWLCVASLLAALPVTPPVVAGVLVDD